MTNKTSPENAQIEETNAESEPVVETVDIETVEVEAQDEAVIPDIEPDADVASEKPDADDHIEPVAKKRAGVPAFVGGAVAAILGFGVAQFVPEGWPVAGIDTSEMDAKIASQSNEIVELRRMIETQASALGSKVDSAEYTTELTALSQESKQDVVGVNAELDALSASVEQLSVRLTDLEKRPISSNDASDAAVAAYERELTAMRETLAAQKSQIETVAKEAEAKISMATSQAEELQAGATAIANAALLRAGMSNINSAIEGGNSFDAALADITKATGKEASAQLQAASISGVATVADLRRAFPSAARAAIAAVAYETTDESAIDRLGAFLRSQTGARSLEPRAGDDPDAILSRAEAAVGDANLQEALSEIASLPSASQEAMADWVKSATYRLETQAAIQTFVSSISEN
ncbi:COG4223 family protein [Falsihalocynthiibacter sp. BN13B15]|uniref:COG4223 family protein n=1 Tax=Falsihalocynthiibacter sp. BN13B15 TaxID=3240871 RepID=UPI00350F25FE